MSTLLSSPATLTVVSNGGAALTKTAADLAHASLEDGEGIAVARIEDPTPDLERWRSYATYLQDRQPALYEELGVGSP